MCPKNDQRGSLMVEHSLGVWEVPGSIPKDFKLIVEAPLIKGSSTQKLIGMLPE